MTREGREEATLLLFGVVFLVLWQCDEPSGGRSSWHTLHRGQPSPTASCETHPGSTDRHAWSRTSATRVLECAVLSRRSLGGRHQPLKIFRWLARQSLGIRH